ncbi:peptide methionine sulfoxide reductase [Saccharata proteae CBS 121410]|uniref:peptide-methionine (S)-S-oxide reductase n=1 Tax=Saccharata proteae CBS 121410 TaxID=1314787 RepID=A0A9P4M035_9PEZI|nr:peptide methionine sulfoxide reductase [Saccharata proteae CBS 121410]
MSSLIAKLTRPFTTAHTAATLRAVPADGPSAGSAYPAGAQKATIAAGCFWGVEHRYRKSFGGKGLLDARVGYIGGDSENPSYRAVCSGRTGHAEALLLIFDPATVSYRTLLEFFYTMHDPTTANSQGPDTGSQYRSAIFYHDDAQAAIAKDVTKRANEEWWKGKVVTEVLPAGKWWDAEDYHQEYLDKNPGGYDCPTHFLRKFAPLSRPEGEA